MKLVDDMQKGSVTCNKDFILIEGRKWCGSGGYFSTKDMEVYLETSANNREVGSNVIETLNRGMHFPFSKALMDSLQKEGEIESEEQFQYLQKRYAYKTKNDMYKVMMLCELELENGKLKISPMGRKGPDNYVELGDKCDIAVRADAPHNLVGAAIRFAFTRCTGNWASVIRGLLFPGGIPGSLEEYLESVDHDYKKWLIAE
jgi:hypothetical protein